MKAKSRRKLLLSSVAMLLVAVLALGTATFAWFTSADTAKATNAQVKATAPTGLEICAVQAGASVTTGTWGDSLNLTSFFSNQLEPVSFNPSGKSASFPIFQTTMNSDGVVTAITSTTADTTKGQTIKNLVAIDIYGKVAGGENKAVKFNLALSSSKSSGNPMRCAIYSVGTGDNPLTMQRLYYLGRNNSNGTTGSGSRSCYPLKATMSGQSIATGGSFIIPNNETAYVDSSNYAYNVASYTSDMSLANSVGSDPVLLGRFLFWVEGQDPWCHNGNKGGLMNDGTGDFTLNFNLA